MKTLRLFFAIAVLVMLTIDSGYSASTSAFMFDEPTTWATAPPTPLNPAVDIDHYTIKWGTTSGVYTTDINIGKVTSFVIPNVPAGATVYAVVTATTATTATHKGGITSANSNEASYDVPADVTPTSVCGRARFAP